MVDEEGENMADYPWMWVQTPKASFGLAVNPERNIIVGGAPYGMALVRKLRVHDDARLAWRKLKQAGYELTWHPFGLHAGKALREMPQDKRPRPGPPRRRPLPPLKPNPWEPEPGRRTRVR